jgi:thioredoxin reductase (NADPH)
VAKPVILIVDDELPVLNAVERDLRQHYRSDYRIVKASAGAQALEAVQQLKQRNVPLALFLVDQRMPAMSGTPMPAKCCLRLMPILRQLSPALMRSGWITI